MSRRKRRVVSDRSIQAELFDAMTFGRTHKRRDFAKRAPRRGAGVLLVARDSGKILLGLRAAWLSDGCTWSTPGGFADYREAPEAAAVRELWEELGIRLATVDSELLQTHLFENGRVRYTTFVVEVPTELEAVADGYETLAAEWFTLEEAVEEDLHPSLRTTLAELGMAAA